MSDEELRELWRGHVLERTWDSFERWARAAARWGNRDGLELVLVARRWKRHLARAEKIAVLRRSEHPRECHLVESTRGYSFHLYRRARVATRGLERDGLLPRVYPLYGDDATLGDLNHPGRAILLHLAKIREQEVRDRATHKAWTEALRQEARDAAAEAARPRPPRPAREASGDLSFEEPSLGALVDEWNNELEGRCSACGHEAHGDPCGRHVRPTVINPERRCGCRG